MLKKITHTSKKEPNRVWYSSDYFDLIVWRESSGEVKAFQLCYDIARNERVLSWRKAYGFTHAQIDSGEQNPSKNQSPLLIADGVLDRQRLLEKFQVESQNIDKDIKEFVIDKIGRYS